MYFLTIFFPFFVSLVVLVMGRFLGSKSVSFLTIIGILISFFCSVYIFYEVIINKSIVILTVYRFIDIGYLNINISLYFDTLTVIMLCVVNLISLLVHIYSIDYMLHDPNFNRFMSYLSLFTFFMLVLVSADNYLLMFVG